MFYIHQSNKTEILKNWLLDILLHKPASDPFQNEQILVQNPGMAQWLQHQIASCLGIAAAIKFPLPSTFIWQLFKHLLSNVPDVSAFTKEAMTWKLMHILPDCLELPEYAPLKHYFVNISNDKCHDNLQDDVLENHQVKIYQLATKIADTFDQYLVYRPDWIKAWEKGDVLKSVTFEQQWQPLLWQKLTQYTQALEQSHWHRGNLYEALIKTIQKTDIKSQRFLPERLFIFGISTLPSSHIQVLQTLGQQIDVHMMVHNPSQFYWGDVKSPRYSYPKEQDDLQFSDDFIADENNTLLASMGKLGRDYHDLLSETEAQENERFTDPVEINNDHTTTLSSSVLQQIQSHIFNLNEPETPAILLSEDDSVTVNSCHSVLREVEVLHDYLLYLMEKDPDLTPKDIIIMTPDVEIYSAPVQAVFSSVSDQRFIPFTISDRNARREKPILETLLKLLCCDHMRCTVTDIMTMLEVPAVMRRYKIQSDHLETLYQWIAESGIRWGLDICQKQQLGLPEEFQNTWQFGLERMLLGYAIKGDNILYNDILPIENIAGSDAALSGLLMEFIAELTLLSKSLQESRTAEQWMLFIGHILETFFLPDEKEEPIIQIVRNILTDFCEQTKNAGFEHPISHAVMMEWLTNHLDSHKISQRFLSGKVNVCSLMPMRSIPFKVICILGMNDGDYPRTILPGSFDLITQFPRRGDRSRRDDDRYLFLEALLAAKVYLYISYTGRDVKDNTERTSSVLLSEFLDYCQRNFNISENKPWVTEHPLQPFSSEYFDKNCSLFTYANEWLASATSTLSNESLSFADNLSLPIFPMPEKIELEQLIDFYRHPCKYFFRNRLDIHFEKLETLPEDDEPFDISGLDSFHLQSMLLEQRLHNLSTEHIIQVIKASGKLPHHHFGTMKLEQITESLKLWAEEIKLFLIHQEEDHEVHLKINDIHITGWVKGIYNNKLIRYRPSKAKNKLLVSSMIEHLVWCAGTKNPGETRVFHLSSHRKDTCVILQPLSQQHSIAALENLLHSYQKGLNEPLPFMPEASVNWILSTKEHDLKSSDKKKSRLKAIQTTKKIFEEEKNRDDYLARVWPEMNDNLFNHITLLAETLLLPLIMKNKDI